MTDKREKEDNSEEPEEEWEWAFLPNGKVTYGLASIVFGASALLLFAVPYSRMLVYPFSAIGLVLAMLELKPKENIKREVGMATAGASLCFVALIVAGLTLAWSNRNPAAAQAAAGTQQTAQVGQAVYVNQAGANVGLPDTIPFPCGKRLRLVPVSSKPDDAPQWIDASSDAAQQGEVAVCVVSAISQRLKLKIGSGTSLLPGKNLVIRLQVVLINSTGKVNFDGWSSASFGDARHKPSLTDNLGNNYKVLDVGAGKQIEGMERDVALYPKLFANDFVIFEEPRENVEFLHLELPAAAFGGTASLLFQIPKSMIEIEETEQSGAAAIQPSEQISPIQKESP